MMTYQGESRGQTDESGTAQRPNTLSRNYECEVREREGAIEALYTTVESGQLAKHRCVSHDDGRTWGPIDA
jgi:hypothetical protein